MDTMTTRISRRAHGILRRLAKQSGDPMNAVLDRAVELYRRQMFLESANQAYAALRKHRKAWQEEMAERKQWDRTLADDLEDQ